MKQSITFHSALAEEMDQFVAFKRMHGYDYTDQARTLSYFDRFLAAQGDHIQGSCLTFDMLKRYVATTGHLAANSRQIRLASLREFSRYLHAKHPASALLPNDILPRHRRTIRFSRIEPEQVVDLMTATETALSLGGILPLSIRVMIGLLYCTGLRIAEALDLTVKDIDPDASTLYVARGKFGKERLVPISASTLDELTRYLAVRQRYAGTTKSSPLFIGAYNTALTYGQAYRAFRRLCRHCKICSDPPPRLHDLRHNYACRRLALWRQAGMDIEALLPVLSTAMGHVNIFSTQIYLHIDAVGLQDAADAFNTYFTAHWEDAK